MLRMQKTRSLHQGYLAFMCFVVICSLVVGGCEPLRKKFRRKKKKKAKIEMPVLEPIEYPAKTYSVEDLYRHYFSLWQVWHKELISEMMAGSNRKRQRYLLDQAIINIEMVQGLLKGSKQEEIAKYTKELRRIQKNIGSPVLKRSISSLTIKLRSLEKKIRQGFSFRNIEDSLKK